MPLHFHNNKIFWRFLVQPFGWLYGIGAWLHRMSYVYGPLERATFAPFVICVGNLSVGGTGKTPHVFYIQRLLGQIEQTAMVSRGYGRQTKGCKWVTVDSLPVDVGDEPLQFKQFYPSATVVVAEKRAEGIREVLIKKTLIQQVILDDAMQHWGVQADCTLLLTTFEAPFFKQTLLPFGRLREFRVGYQRADVIIVTKCPRQVDEPTRAAYKKAIAPLQHQHVLFSWLVYQPLYELLSRKAGPLLEEGTSLELLVITGIANPQSLEKYLNQRHRVTYQHFPDHHFFTLKDLQLIQTLGVGKIIITTEKDATKLRILLNQYPEIQLTIYVLPIEVMMSAIDEAWLVQYLQERKKISDHKKNSH